MDIEQAEIERIAGSVPGAVAVYRIENGPKMLYFAHGLPKIMGFSDQEYARRSDEDNFSLVVEQDRARLLELADKLSGDDDIEYSFRIRTDDGGFRWMHVRARRIGSQDGYPVALVSYLGTSIETRIHEELLDRGDSVVYVSDRKTWELLYANRSALDFWHCRSYLGSTCFSLFRGLDAPCPWCTIPKLVAGELFTCDTYDPGIDHYWHLECRNITWYGREAFYIIGSDITARMKTQRALEESRRRYKLAIDGADIAVWEYDVREHRIYSPENSLSRFRLPEVVEDVPDSLLGNIFEQDREAFADMYHRIDAGEPSATCEFGGYLTGGDTRSWARVTCTAAPDEDGSPCKAYCVLQDMTAQHFMQEQYEEDIRQLFTVNPSTLCSLRLNLTRNTCDSFHGTDAYTRLLSDTKTVDELTEKVVDRIVGDDAKRMFLELLGREAALRAFHEGRTEISYTYRRKLACGETRWITTRSNMVLNPLTHDIMGVISVFDSDDETTRNQIMDLITTEDYDFIGVIYPSDGTVRIFYSSPLLSIPPVSDERTRPVDYEYVCRMTLDSQMSEESRKRFWANATIPELSFRLKADGYHHLEVDTFDASGDTRRKQLTYHYIDEMHDRILVMQHDITALYLEQSRRQAELTEQLAREQTLKDEAERANEAKSSFLSSMSHDMRTPLNGIIGFTGLALETDDPSRIRDYLGKIKVSGSLLLDLVNDTLMLSKAESGKLIVEEEPTLPSTLIKRVVVPVCETADSKGVRFIADSERLDDMPVWMDELDLSKILLNLLSNAVKFTPEGGTVKLVAETLRPPLDDMNTRFTVSDDGRGIGPDFLPHIFEPFTQEHVSGSRNESGTGLGLAIVHQLVNLLGGRIEVASALGSGSTFTVLMNLRPAEEGVAKTEATPAPAHGDIPEGMKVLLCEDNELNAEIACTLLAHKGIETVCATDGKKGVDAFSTARPGTYQAILMDLRMPVMDGYTATRAIRALEREDAHRIPIIAMSADAYESDVRRSLDAGMDAHIAKPVDPDILFRTLSELCGQTQG